MRNSATHEYMENLNFSWTDDSIRFINIFPFYKTLFVLKTFFPFIYFRNISFYKIC